MGRPGRYTLSFMAWVAAYAGWSTIIGLVIAAITGDEPRSVSPATSALFNVIGPLVPTLVALWFNDWAREGFPTREQRRAGATVVAQEPPVVVEGEASEPAPEPLPPAAPALTAPAPAPVQPNGAPRVVQPHPLGVPAANSPANAASGAFPVAPLLRDRD
jgi:hypothetical protein